MRIFWFRYYTPKSLNARVPNSGVCLLFGWMRAWRGGIGAAALVHALSNVYGDMLARGW